MTGKEKMRAALSEQGSPQIPVVFSYTDFFIRDHWDQLTDIPWWWSQTPDIERQVLWRKDVYGKIPIDWYEIPVAFACSREDRENIRIEEAGTEVFTIDLRTGARQKLIKPHWSIPEYDLTSDPDREPQSIEDIEAAIPLPQADEIEQIHSNGSVDLPSRLGREFGQSKLSITDLESPLSSVFFTWGYETTMILIASRPDLVELACERFFNRAVHHVRLMARMGVAAIWIEEMLSDMIQPKDFDRFAVTYLKGIIEEIRSLGMRSIYFFCGNPHGRWDHILSTGADGVAFEESKKGFEVDIEDVVKRVNGRATVFGNLDTVTILAKSSPEQLAHEIKRQIKAGRANDNRFVMSTGSPITPATTVDRVRAYIDLVHQLGSV